MYTFNAIEKQEPVIAMKLLGIESALAMVKFVCGFDSDSRLRNFAFSIKHDEDGVMHLLFDHDGTECWIGEGDIAVKLHDGSLKIFSEDGFNDHYQTRV